MKRRILALLLLSLILRLAFIHLTGGYYDPDEFVNLSQGKYLANGFLPYREFISNHPPGIMVLFAIPHLFFQQNWLLIKILTAVIDSITVVLVYGISKRIFDERISLIAGLLYAVNPISIATSTMAMQEPYVAFLALLAIYILTSKNPRIISAAFLIAVSVLIKYLAVLIIPVYLLITKGKQRVRLIMFTLIFTFLLLAPFLPQIQSIMEQTIFFHIDRPIRQELPARVFHLILYGILFQPFAVLSLKYLKEERIRWPYLGYASMLAFPFLPNAYYHYFAIIVPFACILSAKPLLMSVKTLSGPVNQLLPVSTNLLPTYRRITSIAIIIFCFGLLMAGVLSLLTNSQYIGTKTLSNIKNSKEVIQFIESNTQPNDIILTDSPEHAYLTGRHNLYGYYWNSQYSLNKDELFMGLEEVKLVIVTEKYLFHEHSIETYYDYPPEFLTYIEKNYQRIILDETTIYLIENEA